MFPVPGCMGDILQLAFAPRESAALYARPNSRFSRGLTRFVPTASPLGRMHLSNFFRQAASLIHWSVMAVVSQFEFGEGEE